MKPADGNHRKPASSSSNRNETRSDMYRSRSEEKQLYDRMIFGVFGGILVIFLAVFYWIIAVDSDYRAVLDPVEM